MKTLSNALIGYLLLVAAACAGFAVSAGSAASAGFAVSAGTVATDGAAALTSRPELEYLKVVNKLAPAREPELIFLLSGQFANANRLEEGIRFFEDLLKDFGPRIDDTQRALYMTALASLRAQHASDISLLRRIGWVRDTVAMLDEAKRLTRGEVFIVRWMSGVVRAQLPAFLNERAAARADLTWCETHPKLLPHNGWLREVYFNLGAINKAEGNDAAAQNYLALSGLQGWDKPITFTTPAAEDPRMGHSFSPQKISEPVPGKVFTLSGFGFTEFYFIVSDDGKELVGIDAGTRPDSASEAYAAFRRWVPQAPPLTSIIVTHAHWDHVGGHKFFRSFEPKVKFYGRENFAAEQAKEFNSPQNLHRQFFGEGFKMEDLLSYRPDVPIDRDTEIRIGGTRFQLLPVAGGETEDALLVYMPGSSVLFAGDITMPYLGAPFDEEGNVDGLIGAIDLIVKMNPRILLHGHEPLTRLFSSPGVLAELRGHIVWLRDRVLEAIRRGDERSVIQQANLIPPNIGASSGREQQAFLVLRENAINRIYDQNVGYWQPDRQGMDYITMADRGSILVDYLGLGEQQLGRAAQRLIDDGKHEQAAALLQWVQSLRPLPPDLEKLRRLANLKLAEKYQEFNPFKFVIYANQAKMAVRQIESPGAGAPEVK